MAYLRTENWVNGDSYTPVYYYICDRCKEEICEAWPHWESDDNDDRHLCWECSYIEGKIDESEYIRYGPGTFFDHATVVDGKVITWKGKTPPWEKERNRKTPEYQQWRTSVFQRDNYTCQKCGQKGGNLNAHHKIQWIDDKDLRYDMNNGITLCQACHRNIHKKISLQSKEDDTP